VPTVTNLSERRPAHLPLALPTPAQSMPPPLLPSARPPTSNSTYRKPLTSRKRYSTSVSDADGDEDEPMEFGDPEADAEGEAEGDDQLYCTCQQKSYGEMIGCDNEKCPYEWVSCCVCGLSLISSVPSQMCQYCRPTTRDMVLSNMCPEARLHLERRHESTWISEYRWTWRTGQEEPQTLNVVDVILCCIHADYAAGSFKAFSNVLARAARASRSALAASSSAEAASVGAAGSVVSPLDSPSTSMASAGASASVGASAAPSPPVAGAGAASAMASATGAGAGVCNCFFASVNNAYICDQRSFASTASNTLCVHHLE
jgi:hypothetical protein